MPTVAEVVSAILLYDLPYPFQFPAFVHMETPAESETMRNASAPLEPSGTPADGQEIL
jgi:hypothetical protein